MYRDSKTLGLCVGAQALNGNEWRAVVHRKRVYGLGRFHHVQRWLQVFVFLCVCFLRCIKMTMRYGMTYLLLPVKSLQFPANLIGLIGTLIWGIL